LKVCADNEQSLLMILSDLYRLGARDLEAADIKVAPAEGDRIVPKGFYSSTNHTTFVKYSGKWLQVEDIKMDSLIVIDPFLNKAFCKTLSKIKKGDLIVIGELGIRVVPLERPREQSTFEFMRGTVSSERPSETLIAQIAKEFINLKAQGGKIALVGGPAIIHTGAVDAVAQLIKQGYVDVLFAGNALAAHDIEYDLLGTSLGMDISTGKPVSGGHKHHIYAISEIMRAGSIAKAVEQGIITSGIMYECVKNNIPFVLAGSLRDDGPLSETIMDLVDAQKRMQSSSRAQSLY
jgi:lysine-ketoglutarate reductase/saccharopine dehydrogenase-like protein (TIGR00300 family)